MSTPVKAEVRMQKKKPVISNTANFFCFNSNVSNLYNNDVLIIKKSRENSFLCERVYLIFLLQLSSSIKELQKHRPVTDIRGRIYNCIAWGIIVQIVTH